MNVKYIIELNMNCKNIFGKTSWELFLCQKPIYKHICCLPSIILRINCKHFDGNLRVFKCQTIEYGSKRSFLNSSSASDQFTIETDTLPIRFGSGVLPATEQSYHKLVLIVPNHNRPNCRLTLLFLQLSSKITGSSPKWSHLLSYNPFNKEMETWLKPFSIRNMYLYSVQPSTMAVPSW